MIEFGIGGGRRHHLRYVRRRLGQDERRHRPEADQRDQRPLCRARDGGYPQREEQEGERIEQIEKEQQQARSEEHTSELQSLMRISYAVFCLKKKNTTKPYKHI